MPRGNLLTPPSSLLMVNKSSPMYVRLCVVVWPARYRIPRCVVWRPHCSSGVLFGARIAVVVCCWCPHCSSGVVFGLPGVGYCSDCLYDCAIRTSLWQAKKELVVRYAGVRPANEIKQEGSAESVKLYVCMLSKQSAEEDIRRIFDPFGEVLEVHVLKHPDTCVSKGTFSVVLYIFGCFICHF